MAIKTKETIVDLKKIKQVILNGHQLWKIHGLEIISGMDKDMVKILVEVDTIEFHEDKIIISD